MPVEDDAHARRRMREQRVSERQVATTLRNPDRLLPGHSGRLVAERNTEAGNIVRVVYEERNGGSVAYVWTVIRREGRRR